MFLGDFPGFMDFCRVYFDNLDLADWQQVTYTRDFLLKLRLHPQNTVITDTIFWELLQDHQTDKKKIVRRRGKKKSSVEEL